MNELNFISAFGDLFYKVLIKEDRWKLYFEGLGNTLLMSIFAIAIGVFIGLMVAVVRNINQNTGKLKILNGICKVYVDIIRGIPMMLQLYIMYFVILGFLDASIVVASIAFGINSGAYVSEIFRAGIMSVDKGQMEAGRSLGLSYGKTMSKIIVPQALKNSIPPLGNEFIALIKETAIVGALGVMDLTKAADSIKSITYEIFFPLMVSAIMYLIIVIGLTQFMKFVERRLSRSDKR